MNGFPDIRVSAYHLRFDRVKEHPAEERWDAIMLGEPKLGEDQAAEILAGQTWFRWIYGKHYPHGDGDLEANVGYCDLHPTAPVAEPEVKAADRPEPLTPAEEYDLRHGLGRFWSPWKGAPVKPAGHEDFSIGKSIAAELVGGLIVMKILQDQG